MTDFVHLHVHTEYSLLDGMAKVEDLMDHMQKNGIDTCAVTDHGNGFAVQHAEIGIAVMENRHVFHFYEYSLRINWPGNSGRFP